MDIRGGMKLTVVLMFAAVTAGCSRPEPPKPAPPVSATAEGKALFEQKCGVCHGLDRSTARHESKEKWTEVVKSMQGKKADFISDAEVGKIVEFLAAEHGKK